MGIIRNRDKLLSHGNVEGRRNVLDILEAGLAAGDPYDNVKNLIRVQDGRLIVGNDRIRPDYYPGLRPPPGSARLNGEPLVMDLSHVKNIYVVGGGKAAQRQAEAIEHVLGDLISEGHVNAKKGDEIRLKRIEVTLAGHPQPDQDSVAGARRILDLEQKAQEGDVVFLSESGGGSALMALPAPGVTLQDMQEVTRLLYFGCGCSMPEINAVRNLLGVVRGRHARHTGRATMIHIATPETPPDLRVHLHDRPTGTDAYQYAIYLLKRYGCWDKVSQAVRDFLLRADPLYQPQNPEDWFSHPCYYFRVMGPEYMLQAAKRKAEQLGLRATILVSSLSDVEASSAGEMCAYIAQEIEINNMPLAAPCVFLCGGEVVVTVGEETGLGGRNQEFALAAAPRIEASGRIVIASADSDGSDGPTESAGAVVDGQTMARARQAGISVFQELRRHNTSPVLRELGDTLETGVLKTNLRDLRVIYVGPA